MDTLNPWEFHPVRVWWFQETYQSYRLIVKIGQQLALTRVTLRSATIVRLTTTTKIPIRWFFFFFSCKQSTVALGRTRAAPPRRALPLTLRVKSPWYPLWNEQRVRIRFICGYLEATSAWSREDAVPVNEPLCACPLARPGQECTWSAADAHRDKKKKT